jgi:hypothetical protein
MVAPPASQPPAWAGAPVDGGTGGWGELAAARPRRATLEQEQKLAEVTRAARRSSVARPRFGTARRRRGEEGRTGEEIGRGGGWRARAELLCLCGMVTESLSRSAIRRKEKRYVPMTSGPHKKILFLI